MDPQLRARAEARLAEAARAAGIADPRPAYRERLRVLRQADAAAFDRAIRHYEQTVLPALTEGDALTAWIEYGRFLAALTAAGATVRIDREGRAAPWATGEQRGAGDPAAGGAEGLVLFMPEDTAKDVLVLSQPLEPSPAQQATMVLLVDRKLRLPEGPE